MSKQDTKFIKEQLETLLKNWNNVDQDWWVNAVKHSIKHCGSFTLVGWVTTTGKDEQIKVGQNV